MVKLKQKRLEWVLKQKDKKNKDLGFMLGVKTRRFQQLKAAYARTGQVPLLNRLRRPKMPLTPQQTDLIDVALHESKLRNAIALQLYLSRYHHASIAHNKIHDYLLAKGIAKRDVKKQQQRRYCRYQRQHSGSLGHLDFHDSRAVPSKKVIVWEDDASRMVLAGGEYDEATTEVAQLVVRNAKEAAAAFFTVLLELNTDQGSQFYTTQKKGQDEKTLGAFETFLIEEGIHHIPSRRNHPQTNGKEERWFRTYEENRAAFASFDAFISWYNSRIHLGLSRTRGITPAETFINKLLPESLLGIFYKQ